MFHFFVGKKPLLLEQSDSDMLIQIMKFLLELEHIFITDYLLIDQIDVVFD